MGKVDFGKEFGRKYFHTRSPDVIDVNNGSFGNVPDVILQLYCDHTMEQNRFIEKYLRYDQRKEYIDGLKAIAKVVNCDFKSLALVGNATTAVHTVLRSYPFKKGDKIVYASTTYGGCSKIIKYLEDKGFIEAIAVEIKLPTSQDDIVDLFAAAIKEHRPTMCFFDTVSSIPALRFPFERLTQLCHDENVLSMVDGAHGIGLLDISIDTLKPDFFVSNIHKWMYVPRGCAFLYVDRKHFSKVHTTPISHSYLRDDVVLPEHLEEYRLIDRFQFVGTENKASISTIPQAINFREEVCGGEKSIQNYCNKLSQDAAEEITKNVWPGMKVLKIDGAPSTALFNVQVPIEKYLPSDFNRSELADCLLYLAEQICRNQSTFVPLLVYYDKVYARFSCQVFNTVDDYVEVCSRIEDEMSKLFSSGKYKELTSQKHSGALFQLIEKFDNL
jgi:selenocysteine lyase/cysteine desulfurase